MAMLFIANSGGSARATGRFDAYTSLGKLG
jgi:hypothetical protein